MDKTYKQHDKFFKYLTKMLRVLPVKTALPKYSTCHPIHLSKIRVCDESGEHCFMIFSAKINRT